jgi:hypothetical protein
VTVNTRHDTDVAAPSSRHLIAANAASGDVTAPSRRRCAARENYQIIYEHLIPRLTKLGIAIQVLIFLKESD